jgi:hypothetical protein
MTNIAGQTRDESTSLTCPKCKSPMEKVTFAGVEVDPVCEVQGICSTPASRSG